MELDTKLEEALKSYEVSFALLPMVSKQQPKATPTQSAPKPQQPVPAKGNRKGTNRFKPCGAKGGGKQKSKFDQ